MIEKPLRLSDAQEWGKCERKGRLKSSCIRHKALDQCRANLPRRLIMVCIELGVSSNHAERQDRWSGEVELAFTQDFNALELGELDVRPYALATELAVSVHVRIVTKTGL